MDEKDSETARLLWSIGIVMVSINSSLASWCL